MAQHFYSFFKHAPKALALTVVLLLASQAAMAQDDPPRNRLNEKTSEKAVELADQMPQYPGGYGKLLDELEANLKGGEGRPGVRNAGCWMVRFTVCTDGQARAASVVPSPSNKISPTSPEGKAASQALWSAMREVVPAEWKPGMQAGKPVAVNILLPIVLR